MRVLMTACTGRGMGLMDRAAEFFRNDGAEVYTAVRCSAYPERSIEEPLASWVDRNIADADALIVFGSTGIAVRLIASHVKDKYHDPAVLVIDERGHYCISLLSGHVGGANSLCRKLAAFLGAKPVVTTATDLGGLFSADTFAQNNGLAVNRPDLVKQLSADLLEGKCCRIWSDDFASLGTGGRKAAAKLASIRDAALTQGGVDRVPAARASDADVVISPFLQEDKLCLAPRCIAVGVGCRKGVSEVQIKRTFWKACRETVFGELNPLAAACAATIELKSGERGLQAFCGALSLPLAVYSAEELMKMEGSFSSSSFVKEITGTDNVCERSAVRLAEGGPLLAGKTCGEGVTVALALMPPELWKS